jgi:hypothetical protein
MKKETKFEIFAKSDYKTTQELYRDVVKWKRAQRISGFKCRHSLDENNQVLVIAQKKGK